MSCDLTGGGLTFAQIVKKVNFGKDKHKYLTLQKFCPLRLEHCMYILCHGPAQY